MMKPVLKYSKVPVAIILLAVLFPCDTLPQQLPPKNPNVTEVKTTRANGMPEDWNLLRVPPLGRPHIDAETLTNDEHEGFTRELVRLDWRMGDGIDLWVIKPHSVKNPPVILYLYSFPSTNHRYQDLEFCKFLTKNGFAAVGFLSALTGERYHDRPMKEWFISDLQEALGTTVHDVQMILDYLAKRGDLDMNRVGMFGDGSGASIAIMAAAVDRRIKVLDLLDPWGDWPDWLRLSSLVPENERADYLKPDFLKNIEGLDPVKWFPQLTSQTVRLQYIKGGEISVTPAVVKGRMEAAAPVNANISLYPDMKEFVRAVASTGSSFDWIKQQVSSLPNPAQSTTADRMPRRKNVVDSR